MGFELPRLACCSTATDGIPTSEVCLVFYVELNRHGRYLRVIREAVTIPLDVTIIWIRSTGSGHYASRSR